MIEEVLDFWFGNALSEIHGKSRPEWFRKNPGFDREIKERFLNFYQQVAAEKIKPIPENPLEYLALIIVLDQFPRNMFREQPQAFATDNLALKYASEAIAQGLDKQLLPVQRWFIYLPFEHSENLPDQTRNLALMYGLKDDEETKRAGVIEYAERHMEVIRRFGRFPHRNHILGRPSTREEEIFLTQPNSSF
ncbi:MAG: hypothetical protein N5P05_000946 [Chroococcopsis gigantea SAG 12.99]|jgi:uncharacterized protein (DUF924 family)|nr:DUF924 domain-containing protein [Chlorogloea purpurea SAG 13.99]MDV2999340.1 hypothetical protein [Chroococcopsis gigantea SAG 12.99]